MEAPRAVEDPASLARFDRAVNGPRKPTPKATTDAVFFYKQLAGFDAFGGWLARGRSGYDPGEEVVMANPAEARGALASRLAVVVGLLGAPAAVAALRDPAPNRDPKPLRAGLFLYAAPGMTDPNFAEAVVLLIAHESSGSFGLIVNRPTRVPLRELLPDLQGPRDAPVLFHWGGPVEPQKIHALVRSSGPSDSARRVLPDVYVTGELSDLRAALSESDPGTKLRVFTGYAGWGKGQLEAEVRAGGWVLDTADARQVFSPDSSGLWERVYSILERLVA